jgi:hypothetical protein
LDVTTIEALRLKDCMGHQSTHLALGLDNRERKGIDADCFSLCLKQ